MLVFMFAAYTEVRWTEVRAPKPERERVLKVVSPAASVPVPAEAGVSEAAVAGGVRSLAEKDAPKPAARTLSAADGLMARISGLACGAGTLAAVCLCVLTALGVCVAGGGCVPGVERAVTAAVWSLVLALLCLPWSTIMPGLGLPGVLAPYTDMTRALEDGAMSSTALHAQWAAAPLVAMFAALGVGLWFRAGVERGVIVLSPSELDRAVEREVEAINRRGVASSTPKAVGALNRAIGEGVVAGAAVVGGLSVGGPAAPAQGAPPGTLSAVERALADAPPPSATRAPRGVADADFKRPI
jgi:hypothetical protein